MMSPRLDLVVFVAISWTLNLLCSGAAMFSLALSWPHYHHSSHRIQDMDSTPLRKAMVLDYQ